MVWKSHNFCFLGPNAKFRNPRTTFEVTPPCAPKYSVVWGANLLLLESLSFCELGAHAKFWNPLTTPSVILVMAVREMKA